MPKSMNMDSASNTGIQRDLNLNAVLLVPEFRDTSFDEDLHVVTQMFEGWNILCQFDEDIHVEIAADQGIPFTISL